MHKIATAAATAVAAAPAAAAAAAAAAAVPPQRFRLGGGTGKKRFEIFTKTWKTKKLQKNIEKIDENR